jgi:glycerol-3-phosphate O-acyltransferase
MSNHGAAYSIDQAARDAAARAQSDVGLLTALWRQSEAARDRRDADFQEHARSILQTIQRSHEAAMNQLMVTVAGIREDFEKHDERDSERFEAVRAEAAARQTKHEDTTRDTFKDIYRKLWGAMSTAVVSLIGVVAKTLFHF